MYGKYFLKKKMILILTWITLLVEICVLKAENILIIHPFYGSSHIMTLRTLAENLATEKKHQVLIIRFLDINSYPPIFHPNITEVVLSIENRDKSFKLVTPEEKGRFNLSMKEYWANGLQMTKFIPLEAFSILSRTCQILLGNNELLHELKERNFKVAIVDLIFNECGLALAHYLGIPSVGYWGFTFASGPAFYTSAFNPPSVMPQTMSSLSDEMSFIERVRNTLQFITVYIYMEVRFLFSGHMIRKYHPLSPSPRALIGNMSGVLLGTMPGFAQPSLLPPTFMEVGGFHLKYVKPLPKDILSFIENSGDAGVILFSMGLTFDAENTPKDVFDGYIKTFGRLKQHVIVKAKTRPSYVPSNVRIYSHVPQADILAHNKTVLFISHGGMHGIIEALTRGVPIVGIPVFFDQGENVKRIAQVGVGEELPKESSIDQVYSTITKVLTNSKYKHKAMEVSTRMKMFGDPTERALWLIDYVMRTNGADHMKLSSRYLNLFQYLCLDVLMFLVLALIGSVYLCMVIPSKFRKALITFFKPNKFKVA